MTGVDAFLRDDSHTGVLGEDAVEERMEKSSKTVGGKRPGWPSGRIRKAPGTGCQRETMEGWLVPLKTFRVSTMRGTAPRSFL